MRKYLLWNVLFVFLAVACGPEKSEGESVENNSSLVFSRNVLDYGGNPSEARYRDMLMFSDQGAWFAYGFPKDTITLGFSGPFLMTQENGTWLAPSFAQLQLVDENGYNLMKHNANAKTQTSFASHLEQTQQSKTVQLNQQLVFASPHTALQRTIITNISGKNIVINPSFNGKIFDIGMEATVMNGVLQLTSSKSNAVGYVQLLNQQANITIHKEQGLTLKADKLTLSPGQSTQLVVAQTFIFPEYSWKEEKKHVSAINFDSVLKARKKEKNLQLEVLTENKAPLFKDGQYAALMAKAHLTLQNNWRVPAGELKHQGLFPSYHYEWFHGFWSWDSWKHAVGLSHFNVNLAKDQIRAMYDFQLENGFIVDCVYRDTTIEAHNYRDTKPPLSAWAVAKVFEKDNDTSFLAEMYPKLKKYHQWWYLDRDHDKDGLCEYGSTDGTLIAAKWESGMDNAIRFDGSQMLKNSNNAFSMDQESVDLNAYLYAEKVYLEIISKNLGKQTEAQHWKKEASILKQRIQEQFFDEESGWFFDTNLDGDKFINGAGSEGWIPLWAKAASKEQAMAIRDKMMDPDKFFVKVPFQTMAADHPKFNPLKGYWRGPNWLDQAYFGIKGLRNYGFDTEADSASVKLIHGAKGLLEPGAPIYENYHPLTGEGLNAPNFSWSAAHLILILTKE